jgi:hypothetical protein
MAATINKWGKTPTESFQTQMANAKKSEIRQYIGGLIMFLLH